VRINAYNFPVWGMLRSWPTPSPACPHRQARQPATPISRSWCSAHDRIGHPSGGRHPLICAQAGDRFVSFELSGLVAFTGSRARAEPAHASQCHRRRSVRLHRRDRLAQFLDPGAVRARHAGVRSFRARGHARDDRCEGGAEMHCDPPSAGAGRGQCGVLEACRASLGKIRRWAIRVWKMWRLGPVARWASAAKCWNSSAAQARGTRGHGG